nr:tagaturonate epimerase family protein [Pelobacter seleniigenes]
MEQELMELAKYSIGTGDRFGRQGPAQLAAVQQACTGGVELAIAWNKSHREHQLIKTDPRAQREAAEQAVQALGWQGQYWVDADHIGLETVDHFLPYCDFFTLDVADAIGQPAAESDLNAFVDKYRAFSGDLAIPGLPRPLSISFDLLRHVAEKYLFATQQAGEIYRHIRHGKGAGSFVAEVSIDETDDPQSPAELLFILAALADEHIPLQTIAPKFSGRFNKGVDYRGNVHQFRDEFEADICVVKYAIKTFGLPPTLKLSVHSGSDKFSIYRPIRELIRCHDVGLHIKTAGTTWLEELLGLAEHGGRGLDLVKQIYAAAYTRSTELCAPYAAVLAIESTALPLPSVVQSWSGERFAAALRHDQTCPEYNPHLRQLLHVGFKIAAEMGAAYLTALDEAAPRVSQNVTENLLQRHIRPLFL